MNKNQKIVMAFVAIAVPLILLSASYQTLATSTDENEAIVIDFAVYPETDTIVVERGKAAVIPLKVEAPRDAEKTLQIRLTSYVGTLDPTTVSAVLSKTDLVLSKQDVLDNRVTDVGNNSVTRDAGVLTLAIPATMSPGTYTFGLEAEQQADGKLADALVSGTIVTIEVK